MCDRDETGTKTMWFVGIVVDGFFVLVLSVESNSHASGSWVSGVSVLTTTYNKRCKQRGSPQPPCISPQTCDWNMRQLLMIGTCGRLWPSSPADRNNSPGSQAYASDLGFIISYETSC